MDHRLTSQWIIEKELHLSQKFYARIPRIVGSILDFAQKEAELIFGAAKQQHIGLDVGSPTASSEVAGKRKGVDAIDQLRLKAADFVKMCFENLMFNCVFTGMGSVTVSTPIAVGEQLRIAFPLPSAMNW